VRLLVEHGADVNARARVLEGEPKREIVDFRTAKDGLALQALLTSFPRGGLTPLLLAAREGALSAAGALVDAGADVNLPDPDEIGPLTVAILNGHFELAALLIERGADVRAAEPTGRTPLWAAIDMHTVEWVPNRPPPVVTGPVDSLAVARLLLDRGADPNARLVRGVPARKADAANHPLLGTGATPLMRAATTADLAAMRLLLEKGADVAAATATKTTALLLAAGLGWRDLYGQGTEQQAIEAVKLCLERGGDINAANDQGNTAMHGAASRGANAIVDFLAANGARADVQNKRGRTPLDEALGQRPSRDATAARLRELTDRAGP
jgi:ankyrin repeat protein